MNVDKALNRLKVIFDDGSVILASVIIKDVKNFLDETTSQLTGIIYDDEQVIYDLESLSTTIIMSVNETGEIQWYSDIWGFEYLLFTEADYPSNEAKENL